MASLTNCLLIELDDGAEALLVPKGDEHAAFELRGKLLEALEGMPIGGECRLTIKRRLLDREQIEQFQG